MVEKQILDSWKEIAAYLKRSEKTCRRLEHEQGLPVHRLENTPKARVFAYKQEIDRWIKTTQHSEKESYFGKIGQKRLLSAAFIATAIAVIAIIVWNFLPQAQFPSNSIGRSPSSTGPAYMQVTYSGIASEPAISPDGSSVAYVSKQPGQAAKLMLKDLSGGKAAELFKEFRIWRLRWSPDGSELLIDTDKEDDSVAGVWLIPPLGKISRPVSLILPFYCWSPDGTQIASAASNTKGFLVTNQSTGDIRNILFSGTRWLRDIDWARKSNLILISTVLDNTRNAIWTIRPDDRRRQKVVEEDEVEMADGRRTIYTTVQPDEGHVQQVIEEESAIVSPRWSGTGNAIYYLRTKDQQQELVKIPIDTKTGKARGLPQVVQSVAGIQGDFSLSIDNARLAFTRISSHSNLWLAEFTNKEKDGRLQTKPLTTGAGHRFYPRISPCGKWIAFASSGSIYKMPIDGGLQTKLTFSDLMHDSPEWSPDGRWIACGFSEGEARNILLIDTNDGSSMQLTSSTMRFYGPVWSPDGKNIAYGTDEGGNGKIWIVDISTGTAKQLAEIQWSVSHFLSWSPGRNILYQAAGNQNFMILDPETGDEKPLVRNSVGRLFHPKYSPDRKKVAVMWSRPGENYLWTGGLWAISLSDNTETHLTSEYLVPVEWSPDGKMVYAITNPSLLQNYSLLAIPAGSGDPQTLFTLPGLIEEVRISPNGQKFVCRVIESKSDVWLMENFDPDQ